jgi:hypothetical protein
MSHDHIQAAMAKVREMNAERALTGQVPQSLDNDPDVVRAKSDLEQAHYELDQAQTARSRLSHFGQLSQPYRMATQRVSAALAAVQDAEKSLRSAERAAGGRHAQEILKEQQRERQKQWDEEQRKHAAQEEAQAKIVHRATWLAVGGLPELHESAWPGIWREMLEQRAAAGMAEQRRRMLERYSHLIG